MLSLPLLKKRAIDFIFYLLTLAVLLLSSCARNEVEELEENASLLVNVVGLEEYMLEETSISSAVRRSSSNLENRSTLTSRTENLENTDLQSATLYTGNDFDILLSEQKTHPTEALSISRKNSSSGNSMRTIKSAVLREPLGNTVKYRLLIYRAGETTPIVNVEATSGTSPNIAIASGFTYRWVAVSTNETTAPTVTNNVVSRSSISNKDFLYASGTITTQYGENYLNMVFKRYTTRIQLTVDSRGMFGSIGAASNISFLTAAGSANPTLTETADFNVMDSTFSNYQAVALNAASMQNVNTTFGASLMSGTIYTVRPRAVAANSLRLRLNPLQLTLDDGGTRTFDDNAITFGSAFSPVRGSSYTITARLIESGVRVGTAATVWARANLTYASGSPSGYQYRFRPHPTDFQFDASVDLWNFGTATPTSTTFEQVDPCARVYPAGVWRLPTAAEFRSLPLPNTLERYVPLLLGGVGLVSNWNRSSQQAANSGYAGMDLLRLAFHGYRTTSGNPTQQPGFLLVGIGGEGHYLSSTDLTTTAAASTIRPEVLYMTYAGLDLLGLLNLADGYTQAVSRIPAALTGAATTRYNQGRSIRCVRNIT